MEAAEALPRPQADVKGIFKWEFCLTITVDFDGADFWQLVCRCF